MEQCFIRVIYRSANTTLYQETFTDTNSVERSFYCLIVNQDRYSLSHEEGVILEQSIADSFLVCHCEGIELILTASSALRVTDKMH